MNLNGSGNRYEYSFDRDYQIILKHLNLFKDELRISILNILHLQEGKGLSFSSISKETSIRPTTLAYHLKVLKKAGLVKKGFKQEPDGRDYTSYTITEQGSSIWSLREIIEMGTHQTTNGKHPKGIPISIKVIPMNTGTMIIDLLEVMR